VVVAMNLAYFLGKERIQAIYFFDCWVIVMNLNYRAQSNRSFELSLENFLGQLALTPLGAEDDPLRILSLAVCDP
jgi:hypothetical protein